MGDWVRLDLIDEERDLADDGLDIERADSGLLVLSISVLNETDLSDGDGDFGLLVTAEDGRDVTAGGAENCKDDLAEDERLDGGRFPTSSRVWFRTDFTERATDGGFFSESEFSDEAGDLDRFVAAEERRDPADGGDEVRCRFPTSSRV